MNINLGCEEGGTEASDSRAERWPSGGTQSGVLMSSLGSKPTQHPTDSVFACEKSNQLKPPVAHFLLLVAQTIAI